MKLLITGAGSGLGKYLHGRFGGIGLTRSNASVAMEEAKAGVDAIVHCAFRRGREATGVEVFPFVEDNLLFTERLTRIPHGRFIYISTIDVYPRDGRAHEEAEELAPSAAPGFYGTMKLLAESIVRAKAKEFTILRAASLLGPDAPMNSIRRILEQPSCELTLSSDSDFNCVLHQDVGDIVERAVGAWMHGIYNVAVAENITLGEIAATAKKTVNFGAHRYVTGPIANAKLAALMPAFRRTSRETIGRYVESSNP